MALKSKYNITESFDFERAEKEALKKEKDDISKNRIKKS